MLRIRFAPPAALPLLCAASLAAAHPAAERPLENIVVTGKRSSLASAAAELERVPGGTTLLDIDSFRGRNIGSLADVLRYVPGVWAVSTAGTDALFLSSRGSNLDATDYDLNGVELLQDGLPVTSADGSNHNRVIDPLSAVHASVMRGANAFRFGAATLGGAVNFVTPTARDVQGREVRVSVGSHGQRDARLTVGEEIGERADALVTVEGKRWEGYRAHNRQQRAGVYANAGWRVSDTLETRLYVTYLQNDQEIPGSLTRAGMAADPRRAAPDAVGGDYRLDVDTLRVAEKTAVDLGLNRALDFGFAFERQKLFHPIVDRVLADSDGPGPVPPIEVFSLLIDTDHRNEAAMLRYRQRFGEHELLVGTHLAASRVRGGHYRNLHGRPNGLTTRIDNEALSFSLYGMDRWSIGSRLTLVLGAQIVEARREVRHIDAATGANRAPHRRYSSFSPRIGLIAGRAGGASFYANLSRLFEPPTNYQLEDNVAGGAAALAPMRGDVVEIGGRGGRDVGGGEWHWDVSMYYASIEDEILSVEDPKAPGTSLATNVDGTVHAGLEAMIAAELPVGAGSALAPVLSATINEFRFEDDRVYGDNRLPAAPVYAIRGEVMYRGARGWYAGPTLEVIGERYADFANTYEIGGYSLIGVRAGWSGERLRVFAELRNLRDADYVASHKVRNAARPEDPILNPGEPMSVYAGFSLRFR